jgi:hypothetical protein
MAKLRMPRERVEKMLDECIRAGKELDAKIKVAEKTRAYRDWLHVLDVWRNETIAGLKAAYEGKDIALEFEAVTGTAERSSPEFTFEYSKAKVSYGITQLEKMSLG